MNVCLIRIVSHHPNPNAMTMFVSVAHTKTVPTKIQFVEVTEVVPNATDTAAHPRNPTAPGMGISLTTFALNVCQQAIVPKTSIASITTSTLMGCAMMQE